MQACWVRCDLFRKVTADVVVLLASSLKSIKGVMAAEYSPCLSDKVFAAQARFIGIGFKQRGHARYGLRRFALKACGLPHAILEYGESKVSATDRVVLVWGPKHKVSTVRHVYSLYLEKGASEAGIAHSRDREAILSEDRRPWTKAIINSLLTNVKYCGALALNRRSHRLSSSRTRNSTDRWIMKKEGGPIIGAPVFDQVACEVHFG